MFDGKTKQGTDVKSTLGMRAGTPAPTWFLVLDSSQARVYEGQDNNRRFPLVSVIPNPAGRSHERDLGSDRPGRSFDSFTRASHGQTGAPRHALANQTAPHMQVTEELIIKAARDLESPHALGRFDKLVLVAEPRVLGRAREILTKHLGDCELGELHLDLAHFSDQGIAEKLRAELHGGMGLAS